MQFMKRAEKPKTRPAMLKGTRPATKRATTLPNSFRGQEAAGTAAASGTTIATGTAGGGTAIELGGRASGNASEH
jgi:hypothetical protein